MKLIKTVLLAGASLAAFAAMPATAQTKLLIGSWAPPTHHINAVVLPTWGKWVQEATKGRVTFEIKYNLTPPPGQFDAVRDGIQDVAWIFHGYTPGKFVATQVMELPFLGAAAEAGSRAYWRIHQKYLSKADEHKGVVVIGLMTHGAGVIQSQRPIKSWADLKGMKIRLPGGIASRVGEAFGAVAVSVPATKVYETLSQKAADAVFMPFETHKSFRLQEVTKYVVRVPGNLYDGSFAIIINPKKLASLSKEDQAALMSVSGEKLSGFAGSQWAAADKAGMEFAKEKGTVVSDASPEMVAQLHKVAATLEADWIKRASGHGYDPAAALKELRATAKELDKK
ncbi:MAG: TRAP transporter substrate-binding protein [Rhodospirillaceae bacterium]|nr:TRAP transporter substrate-binding protein [Rhodospirillaceae bacterium]